MIPWVTTIFTSYHNGRESPRIINPVAGAGMASLCVVFIRGTSTPFDVDDTSSIAEASAAEPEALTPMPWAIARFALHADKIITANKRRSFIRTVYLFYS